jgi:hypothetical protein
MRRTLDILGHEHTLNDLFQRGNSEIVCSCRRSNIKYRLRSTGVCSKTERRKEGKKERAKNGECDVIGTLKHSRIHAISLCFEWKSRSLAFSGQSFRCSAIETEPCLASVSWHDFF